MRLEHLGACPLCGSKKRRPLHAALTDSVYGTVPGRFALWRCEACEVGYLDPRPTREDIAEAYAAYQTHVPPDDAFAAKTGALGRFRRAARNAYVNRRYGYTATPASALGGVLLAWSPLRFNIDQWIHRLPARPGGRLLDFGCGNGAWLAQMRALGWQAEGVDFDPRAVAAARSAGLQVHEGGIDTAYGLYDAIALNHVIEHVHDPRALLHACHERLHPQGQLWIATPNLDAMGHGLAGAAWRGLEAPRHLFLFNAHALSRLMQETGFVANGPLRTRAWGRDHFPGQALRALVADLAGLVSPRRQEELVFTAKRA